jgi:uracil-DNA glycosylase family 4
MIWQGLTVPDLEGFTGFVPPDGTGSSHVMLMGEAPGEQEIKHGRGFYEQAPAGAVLARLLRRAGLERDSFVVSNAVWSRPPNNYLDGARYEGAVISAFEPFRDQLFRMYRPRVTVALGGIALRTLTNYGGKGAGITACQGYVLDGPWPGTWVIGAMHPSAILRGESRMSGVVIWALQRALEVARNGFVRHATRYVTTPGLDDMLAFERGYNPERHILSLDIETPESASLDEEEVEDREEDISYNIIRASLCYDGPEGYAVSFPWQPPYIQVAIRMLGSPGPKRTWNGTGFDNPRLAAAGAPVRGRHYDCMWAWKHLQPTLPRSLGFVAPFYGWTGEPWKHTSDSEPERYSCADAHATQLIGDGVDAHLKQKGMWDVYERHVVDVSTVLDRMSHNGLPYSQEKAGVFRAELEAKYEQRFSELQARVPIDIRPSKQKNGYKKVPPSTTGLARRLFSVLGQDMTEAELAANPVPPLSITKVERWCVLEPFLPTSTQQVQALLKWHGLPVGKNRKTKADTADDEHLRKVLRKIATVKKHSEVAATLQMIRECRQLSKVLGTYVKGWRPGRDGRIHATPGFWGRMFRISWRRPNISATIQDKEEAYVASGFRRCVACTVPKQVLLEADWRGIEAVLVGWFANDPDYMRLARLGVHSFMASHMLGSPVDLSWSDRDLTECFRGIKRTHPEVYDDAKHTVHGTNYGMGPFLMAEQYEMTVANAKRLQGLYFELFPKVRAWQKSVLDRASRECRLRNPFGYEMSFWEVYRWDSKKQDWTLGEDAKSAIAFLPRDTAAAMLKEVLLRLRTLADAGIMLACTHDSITCEMPEHDLMTIASLVKAEMERPVPELGGLSIGVECKAGDAWHEDCMSPLVLKEVAYA